MRLLAILTLFAVVTSDPNSPKKVDWFKDQNSCNLHCALTHWVVTPFERPKWPPYKKLYQIWVSFTCHTCNGIVFVWVLASNSTDWQVETSQQPITSFHFRVCDANTSSKKDLTPWKAMKNWLEKIILQSFWGHLAVWKDVCGGVFWQVCKVARHIAKWSLH